MADFVQVGVIGLGKFGYKFGEMLAEHGVNVLGVDRREERVKQARHVFTKVMQADAANQDALLQMGLGDLSHVLISVGESIASSAMIAMFLKELQVPVLWAKAANDDHAKLLRKIGVDEVVIPEHVAARQFANRVTIPGFIDYFPFNQEVLVKKITIRQWAGKTLRDTDPTNRFGVQVIAVKRKGESEFRLIPKADDRLHEGDELVVVGEISRLTQLNT